MTIRIRSMVEFWVTLELPYRYIVIQYNPPSSMRGKNPRKYKRYLTQPEQFPTQNLTKFSNLTLKDLKLQVGSMQTFNDVFAPCLPPRAIPNERMTGHFVPLQARIQNKRNALKKLPELINAPHFINGKEQHNNTNNPHLFKANNPLFVVNTLFEIMKEDIAIHDALPSRQLKQRKGQLNTDKKRSTHSNKNQFDDPSAKSMKVHRPPRILDNEINRLAQQSTFSRRKIYSQEKSRQKMPEKEVQLLTFYKPREKIGNCEETNEFL